MLTGRSILSVVVGALALAGIGGSFVFLSTGGNNEGFEQYPTITNLHVVPGVIYLILAPLQFSSRIRNNNLRFHRWSGRLLTAIGLILGAAALFLGVIVPYSGLPEQIVIGFFGLLFLLSLVKGFSAIRDKDVRSHREWMLRAFAIGLSIATMRLIFVPMLIVVGEPTREEAELFSIVSFTIAFTLHSGFAEYWIRHTRPEANRRAAVAG